MGQVVTLLGEEGVFIFLISRRLVTHKNHFREDTLGTHDVKNLFESAFFTAPGASSRNSRGDLRSSNRGFFFRSSIETSTYHTAKAPEGRQVYRNFNSPYNQSPRGATDYSLNSQEWVCPLFFKQVLKSTVRAEIHLRQSFRVQNDSCV